MVLTGQVGDGPADEVGRFNAELDAHHWLGHRLTGQVLRYVAVLEDEWVALVGFGSAALSCAARRDRFWQRVGPAQGGGGWIGQQRPVGQEVPTGEQNLRQRPVALSAGV